MHCLLAGMNYYDKINIYGLSPIIIGVCMLLPLLFLKKVTPAGIVADKFRPLCVFKINLQWVLKFITCSGGRDASSMEEGVRIDLVNRNPQMTAQELEQQVEKVNQYNAHVKERVWFWLLFW